MRRILWGFAAVLGIMGAMLVHGSLMVVEQENSEMLPDIEPGQKVLVYLLEKDYSKGDIVAFTPPYYTVGGSGVMLLCIDHIENDTFTLVSGDYAVSDSKMKVERKDILGKAVFYG
ncbi:MAG: S24/S26 family peptidase [Firmicutes bacterium]|nr:S24/S26 family peptidase [Bacillota bacterium]